MERLISRKPIRRLSADVINRIAAGEIVQRPAAALKELLENSIDAGSRNIIVTVRDGGLSLLQVTDDGSGIDQSDLPLLCERFTTSKLRSFEELLSMSTFGFRGEALASISQVAHVTCMTRTASSLFCLNAKYQNGKLLGLPIPQAGNIGTTICIEDMFYNINLRKQTMMARVTEEYAQISEVVVHYAFEFPSIGFGLKKITASSGGGGPKGAGRAFGGSVSTGLSMRIDYQFKSGSTTIDNLAYFYGAYFAKGLHCFEYDSQWSRNKKRDEEATASPNGKLIDGKKVNLYSDNNTTTIDADGHFFYSGYCSGVNLQNTRQTTIIFINKRRVESAAIKKAIDQAYAPFLVNRNRLFLFLHLIVQPDRVDVNIHPTKREVLLLDEEVICTQLFISLTATIKADMHAKRLTVSSMPVASVKEEKEKRLRDAYEGGKSNDTNQQTPIYLAARMVEQRGDLNRMWERMRTEVVFDGKEKENEAGSIVSVVTNDSLMGEKKWKTDGGNSDLVSVNLVEGVEEFKQNKGKRERSFSPSEMHHYNIDNNSERDGKVEVCSPMLSLAVKQAVGIEEKENAYEVISPVKERGLSLEAVMYKLTREARNSDDEENNDDIQREFRNRMRMRNINELKEREGAHITVVGADHDESSKDILKCNDGNSGTNEAASVPSPSEQTLQPKHQEKHQELSPCKKLHQLPSSAFSSSLSQFAVPAPLLLTSVGRILTSFVDATSAEALRLFEKLTYVGVMNAENILLQSGTTLLMVRWRPLMWHLCKQRVFLRWGAHVVCTFSVQKGGGGGPLVMDMLAFVENQNGGNDAFDLHRFAGKGNISTVKRNKSQEEQYETLFQWKNMLAEYFGIILKSNEGENSIPNAEGDNSTCCSEESNLNINERRHSQQNETNKKKRDLSLRLYGFPMLAGPHWPISQAALPLCIHALANNVNFNDEYECFDNVSTILADTFSAGIYLPGINLSASAKENALANYVDNSFLALLSNAQHFMPPDDLLCDGTVRTVVTVEALFKVFERC